MKTRTQLFVFVCFLLTAGMQVMSAQTADLNITINDNIMFNPQIPVSQFAKGRIVTVNVANFGETEVTNIKVSCDFNGTIVTEIVPSLGGSGDNTDVPIALPDGVVIGNNTLVFSVEAEGFTESDPEDNTAEMPFIGTENLYALDKTTNFSEGYGGNNSATNIYYAGNVFQIYETMTIYKVQLAFRLSTEQNYNIALYEMTGATSLNSVAIFRQAAVRNKTGLHEVAVPKTRLEAGKRYYLCVEQPTGTDNIGICYTTTANTAVKLYWANTASLTSIAASESYQAACIRMILPDNDLAISTPFYNTLNSQIQMPINQFAQGSTLYATVTNNGVNTLNDVVVSATMNGTTIGSSTPISLLAGESDTVEITTTTSAAIVGANELIFTATFDGTDDYLSDNTTTVVFTGTKNVYELGTTTDFGTGAAGTALDYTLGNIYKVYNTVEVSAVSASFNTAGAYNYNIAIYEITGEGQTSLTPLFEPVAAIRTVRGWNDYVTIPTTILEAGKSYYICLIQKEASNMGVTRASSNTAGYRYIRNSSTGTIAAESTYAAISLRMRMVYPNDLIVSTPSYSTLNSQIQLPINQFAQGSTLYAIVTNDGANTLNDIVVSATLNGTVVGSSTPISLLAGESETVEIITTTSAATVGANELVFTATFDGTEDYLPDNTTTVVFTGTKNVYELGSTTQTTTVTDREAGVFMGNIYRIYNNTTISAVSVAFGSSAALQYTIALYEMDGALTTAADPIFSVGATRTKTSWNDYVQVPPTTLEAGKSYYLCVTKAEAGTLGLYRATGTGAEVGKRYARNAGSGNVTLSEDGGYASISLRMRVVSNDLVVSTPYYSTINPYYQLPITQFAQGSTLYATVTNDGSNTLNDAVVFATINGTAVGSSTPISLLAGESETVEISTTTSAATVGTNELVFTAAFDGTDDYLPDNTAAIEFTGTKNVYALDNNTTAFYRDQKKTFGSIFPVYQTMTLNEVLFRRYIVVALDNLAINFDITVYRMNGDLSIEPVPVVTHSSSHTGTAMPSATDWISISIPSTELTPGRYFVTIKSTDPDVGLGIYADGITTNSNSYFLETDGVTFTPDNRTFTIRLGAEPFPNDLALDEPAPYPYSEVPTRQTLPERVVVVNNIGTQAQTNVTVSAILNDEVAATSTPLASLASEESESLTVPEVAIKLGTNNLLFQVSQDETDGDPSDNKSSTKTFTGTANTFVMDDGNGTRWNSGHIGSKFLITQTTTLNQVRVRRNLDNKGKDATNFTVYVHKINDDTLSPEPLAFTPVESPMTAVAGTMTAWLDVDITPTTLLPGEYFVSAVSDEDGKELYLGLDEQSAATTKTTFWKEGNKLKPYENGRRANIRLITDLSDAGVTAITAPVAKDVYDDNETVTVEIKNFAAVKMSGVYVNALVNGTPLYNSDLLIWNTEADSLDVNEVREYEFTIPANMIKGENSIRAYAYGVAESAEQHANDTVSITPFNSLYDLEVMAFVAPISGVHLSATAPVTVKVANHGTSKVTNAPISLMLGETMETTENIPEIDKGDTVTFTFQTKTFDLSAFREYTFTAIVQLPNDEDASNDTLKHVVTCFDHAIVDVAVTSVAVSADTVGSTSVSVSLRNNGNEPVSDLTVYVSVNGGTPITGVIDNIEQFSDLNDFRLPSDLTLVPGRNVVKAWITTVAGDTCVANDTLSKVVIAITAPQNLAVKVNETTAVFTWSHNKNEIVGFNVYLDGDKVAGEIADTFHTFTNLVNGDYEAGVEAVYMSGISERMTKTFTVSTGSGITDKESEIFTIYPNPVSDRLFVKTTASIHRIDIYDFQGKLVKVVEGHTSEISVNELKPGTYMITLTTTKGVATQRFVKQ